MIPYADLTYWGVLLYPTLPTFFVAWGRRLRQSWILLATLGMLVVQYPAERVLGQNAAVREIWLVVGFGVFEYLLARGWLAFRRSTGVLG